MNLHPSIKTMAGWLDGTLPDRAKARFEAHVETCERCRRQLEVLKRSSEVCAPSAEDLDAISAGVMGRIVGRVGRVGQVGQVRQVGPGAEASGGWNLDAPIVGEIAEVEGTVLVRRGAGDEGVEAFPGCAVREGERLEPVDGGRAVVALDHGGRLKVSEALVLTTETTAAGAPAIRRAWSWLTGAGSHRKCRLRLVSAGTLAAAAAVYAVVLAPVYEQYRIRQAQREVMEIAKSVEQPVIFHGGYPLPIRLEESPEASGERDWEKPYHVAGNPELLWGRTHAAGDVDNDGDDVYYLDVPESSNRRVFYVESFDIDGDLGAFAGKVDTNEDAFSDGRIIGGRDPYDRWMIVSFRAPGTVSPGDVWHRRDPGHATNGKRNVAGQVIDGRNRDDSEKKSVYVELEAGLVTGEISLFANTGDLPAGPALVPSTTWVDSGPHGASAYRRALIAKLEQEGILNTLSGPPVTVDGAYAGGDKLHDMAFAQDLRLFQNGLEAPILSCLPDITISDVELNAPGDANLLVFSDALQFDELVADADGSDSVLRWSGVDPKDMISINGLLASANEAGWARLDLGSDGPGPLEGKDLAVRLKGRVGVGLQVSPSSKNFSPKPAPNQDPGSRSHETLVTLYVSDGTTVQVGTMRVTTLDAAQTPTIAANLLNVAFVPGMKAAAQGMDSGRLTVKSQDGAVKIRRVDTGQEVATLWGDLGPVTTVAFSPDGQQIATGSADNTATLWDIQTGKQVHSLAAGEVAGVAFSPDGRQLTTTGKDKTVKLWDAETGALVRTIDDNATDAEDYDKIVENDFMAAQFVPLSTFSIDVDTASYSNVRRFLNAGQRPPRNAVRIEELINYFHYEYPDPIGEAPFAVNIEIGDCPWNEAHRLARIGLKGQEMSFGERPQSNLVFLLDVSGSMSPANKLPLVKQSLRMLVENLTEDDRVSIVVYASATGLVLPPTRCGDKRPILEALDRLKSGGSTDGGSGIMLAYKTAHEQFIEGGVNRVILATDGDFNVGITDREDLIKLIEEEAKLGCFLTVLGFGMGNLKDATLEQLADKGNGNYAYIDGIAEAQKALVEELNGTLVTVAKDVKIQVEFNPTEVAGYRLIGYENRMLKAEDFNDDTKDAGEMGAAHRVTALYEIVPAGGEIPAAHYSQPEEPAVDTGIEPPGSEEGEKDVDPLRYQEFGGPTEEAKSGEMLTVKLRYKEPDGHRSKLLTFPVADEGLTLDGVSTDYMFVAAVASFGMVLRDSQYCGTATLDMALQLAGEGKGADPHGYRAQFIELVNRAKAVMGE